MIHIISGEINSGKTSLLLRKFIFYKEGVGVFSIKKDNEYNALLLKFCNKRIEFIDYINLLSDIPFNAYNNRIGKFYFSEDSFIKINNWLAEEYKNNQNTFYIDEIGNLELNENGFYTIINFLRDKNINLNINIRLSSLRLLINKFNISHKFEINII